MRRMVAELSRDWSPPKIREWFARQLGGIRIVPDWPECPGGGWSDAAQESVKGHEDGVARVTSGACIGVPPGETLSNSSDASKQSHDLLVQLGLVVARAATGCEGFRLLDFGGGLGIHALAVARLLPELRFEYTVADLSAFCEVGRRVNPRVRFVTSLQEAGQKYHLVYASSSVQYSQDWRTLMANLCDVAAKTLFVTRTPFVFHRPAFVTIQRAYKTQYPGWVFNYQDFVGEVSNHGFALKEVFLNGRGIAVRGVSDRIVHVGLLFERVESR